MRNPLGKTWTTQDQETATTKSWRLDANHFFNIINRFHVTTFSNLYWNTAQHTFPCLPEYFCLFFPLHLFFLFCFVFFFQRFQLFSLWLLIFPQCFELVRKLAALIVVCLQSVAHYIVVSVFCSVEILHSAVSQKSDFICKLRFLMPADHVCFYYYAQWSPWHLMWFWNFSAVSD